MCAVSKSSVVMDFCHLQLRPSPKLVKKFIAELNVQFDSLLGVQIQSGRRAVLDFTSPEVAAAIINKPLVYQGNKIPIYLEDDAVDVYVHDLPLGMSNDDIAKAMSHYGQIVDIKMERWMNYFPGILNGVRMLRVLFKKPVPKYLTVMNKTGTVRCNGQKPICKLKAKKNANQKEVNKQQDMNEDINNKQQQDNNNNSNQQKQQQESSSSSNNRDVPVISTVQEDNQSNSNNNNNDNSGISDKADTNNDQQFEIVLSKSTWKNRKRQLAREDEILIPEYSKAQYYKDKLNETKQKLNEAKCENKKEQLSEAKSDDSFEQIKTCRKWLENLKKDIEAFQNANTSDEDE